MKSLVVALCTALFVFALASAWSDMLQSQLAALAQKSTSSRPAASTAARSSPHIARPIFDPDGEDDFPAPIRVTAKKSARKKAALPAESPASVEPLEEPAATLREQMAEVKAREARLLARQETLRLICNDIHEELALVDDVQREAADALFEAEQKIVTVAQRGPVMGGNGPADSGRPTATVRDSDTTPPSSTDSPAVRGAVLLVRRLASQGSADTATSLLRRMKEREAAKVLTALSRDNPELASRLMRSLEVARKQALQY